VSTMAGARISRRKINRTGRSFALLDEATRERLASLLHPLPWVDGLVTAEVTVTGGADDPRMAEQAPEWLHFIWSEVVEEDTLTVARTAEVMAAAVNHHQHIATTLMDDPEAYRPYLSGFNDVLEAAAEWADGFRCGIRLHPEVRRLLSDDEEVQTLLTAVFGLLRDEDVPEDLRGSSPFRHLSADRRERMRRETVEMLPRIVHALRGHMLDLNEADVGCAAPYVSAGPKVGRNDPCPCGSGKKHKKCCLGKE
jgi:uncharacterized protein